MSNFPIVFSYRVIGIRINKAVALTPFTVVAVKFTDIVYLLHIFLVFTSIIVNSFILPFFR